MDVNSCPSRRLAGQRQILDLEIGCHAHIAKQGEHVRMGMERLFIHRFSRSRIAQRLASELRSNKKLGM